MRHALLKYPVIVLCGLLFCACSVTRHLPPNAYMLNKNVIEIDKEAPRDERITAAELDSYIRQSPAKKLLGTNIPVWIYNQANPDKQNFWNNFLRRVGNEPVILDTMLTEISDKSLKLYMNSRGFYDSKSNFSIKYKPKKQKATVTYSVVQGRPFRIKSISYDYQDKFLEQVIKQDSVSTLLKTGEIFDLNVLNQERKRITDYLKNKGYYNFSINNINYIADTTAEQYTVDLTMVIKQHLEGYNDNGDPIWGNNAIYRIQDIYVHPDYNPTKAATDPDYYRGMDTTYYQGLRIVSKGKPFIRPRTLRRAIPIYEDYVYSYEERQRTSSDLLWLKCFKNASLLYSQPTSTEDNYVTYVGDDTSTTPVETIEKPLICNIYCVPALKQGYTLDFEATVSSAFYALRPTISYINRNLFRGAELLNISLTAGYEFNRNTNFKQNSYEIGASASISFPRFIAPWRIDRAGRLTLPQTKFEISTNLQRKSKYHRTITGGNISYTWGNKRHSSYTFRPIDLNIVNVTYIDQAFLCDIQNSYLRESYKSQFISAISGSWVYNNPKRNARGNSLTIRVNLEASGNVPYLFSHLLTNPVTERININDCGEPNNTPTYETFYKIFNIRFSQYFRIDASVSNTIPFPGKLSIAYRFYGGIGVPYGNSSSIPMDRMFYVGGSNSMRGWMVRTLGPGNSPDGRTKGFNNQLGNVKLEANFEFRFPIWSSLYGALFFDAGNIWVTNIPGAQPDEIFRFDSFYKQLGLNTGFGVRYDLGLVVVRFDWGMILHDPSRPAGERWIKSFKWGNTALNFGIGLPF